MRYMNQRKFIIHSFIVFLFFMLHLSTPARGDGSLGEILNPGRLPYLKNSKSIQISSWDTTGENADFHPISPGKTINIANINGPGVITHLWCTIASDDPQILRNL